VKTALAYVGAVFLFFVLVAMIGYLGAKIETAGERMPRRQFRGHRRRSCRCAKPSVRRAQ